MKICEECKQCFNFEVSEIGCFGSDKPCKHYAYDCQSEFELLAKKYGVELKKGTTPQEVVELFSFDKDYKKISVGSANLLRGLLRDIEENKDVIKDSNAELYWKCMYNALREALIILGEPFK